MANNKLHRGLLKQGWQASRSGIAAIIVFGAFINLLKFAMPMYTLQILDRVPDSRSVETLVMLTIIALFAVLSGVVLESVRRRLLVRWSSWLNRYLGPHLVQSAIDGAGDARSPSPSSMLDSLQTVRSFIEKSIAPLFDVLWVPVFLLVVFLIHPLFGAIMLTTMGLRLLSGFIQNRITRPSRDEWSEASREARSMIDAAERHADSIGAAGMSERLSQRWLDNIRTKMSEREASQDHDSAFLSINTGLYRVLYVFGMGFGVWLVVQNSMTIGGIIAANIIMRFGFRLLDRGVRRWGSLARARKAYRRLQRQLDSYESAPLREIDARDLEAPFVMERVSHRHSGQADSILRKVDLTLEAGEMLCVIGRCASGKSSFARLVSGAESPRAGHIRLGNMELSCLAPSQLHSIVGYMPQEARLFSGSVRDNISALRDCEIADVMDAARLAGIHERIIRLPEGYDTRIDHQTNLLSAGERRLVLIARALFGRPRLVVLDEPEAHLDRPSLDALAKAFNALKADGCSLIVMSQSNWLGKLADKTFLLGASRNRPGVAKIQAPRKETQPPALVGENP
jgi:ATP-binding cassette subfamily C exporter for protease/lipase